MTDGTLDTIVALFQGSSLPLFGRIFGPMKMVFLTLFVIDFSWDAGIGLLTDSSDFWGRMARKLVVFALLYGFILTIPFWLWRVLDGFAFLAQDLTGLSGLSPSAVLDTGVDLFFSMFTAWEGIVAFVNPIGLALRLITALILLLAFVLIAAYQLRVLIESALALGALPFFLAFAGHKLTWGFAEGFLRYVANLGVRLFVVYLLIGVGSNLAAIWRSTLEQATLFDAFADPQIFIAIPVTAAIWAGLVFKLPDAIAREITAPISMSALNPMGRASR
ncbi:MAG: type IV secretion system protein [bacterium]